MTEQPGLDWLRAVIEGDKAQAERLLNRYVTPEGAPYWPTPRISYEWSQYLDPEVAAGLEFIQTHDPRDVIARCEAELAILDEHRPVTFTDLTFGIYDMQVCMVCHARLDEPDDHEGDDWTFPLIQMHYPCRTVRLLASGYKHRPGWTDDWKP